MADYKPPASVEVISERIVDIMSNRLNENLTQEEVNAVAEAVAGVDLGQGPVVGSKPATNKRRENTGDSR